MAAVSSLADVVHLTSVHIIRLRRIHEIRTIVIVDPSVCQFVCHTTGCVNTAERIEVLFGEKSFGAPRHIVLDRVLIPYGERWRLDAAFVELLLPINDCFPTS